MKRIAWIPLAGAAVLLLGYGAYRSFASDETKIRWAIEDAAEAFNEANLAGCLELFAQDYQDEMVSELKLENLTQTLRYGFLNFRHPVTKAFELAVRVLEEDFLIQVEGDAGTAEFLLRLEELADEDWQSTWELRVKLNLRRTDDGWRVHRSRHETLSGARPR